MHGNSPVATVSFVNGKTGIEAKDVYSIRPKSEQDFGSEHVQQHVKDYDLTISRRQVTIRCVLFDEDASKWGVAPMVYAQDQSMNGTTLVRLYQDENGNVVENNCQLTKCTGPVLLQDDDRLYFSKTTYLAYKEIDPVDDCRLDPVMDSETQRFLDEFVVFPRLIGAGGQGKVFIAWDHERSSQAACKTVSLEGVKLETRQVGIAASSARGSSSGTTKVSEKLLNKVHKLEVEYDILKDLNHPNIIDMRKVFVTTHHIYIMQELMSGGDLFSFINYKGGNLDVVLSAVMSRQILKAVEYLHDNGIVHRDIKPDNILMTSWKDSTRIVLTDFGLAKRLPRPNNYASQFGARYRMFSVCGTAGFAAPEIHRLNPTIDTDKGYSSAIDMWAIGTVISFMLTGSITFQPHASEDDMGPVASRTHSAFDFSIIDRGEQGWQSVPRRAREFVKSLLVLDETKRLTAKQALQHKWFTNHTCASSFDAVYEHSIRDWKPRTASKQDIVVEIDTSDIVVSSQASTIIKSQHFRKTAMEEDHYRDSQVPETDFEADQSDVSRKTSHVNRHQQPSPEYPWPSPRSRTRASSQYTQNLDASAPSIPSPPASQVVDVGNMDLDAPNLSFPLKIPAQQIQPSPEFTWPSSPPRRAKAIEPSFEFPWPSQPPAKSKV